LNHTSIIESISLTYKEAEAVNSQTNGSKWSVGNKQLDNGIWSANVIVCDDKKVMTEIKVYSNDGKVWVSSDYVIQAMTLEEKK
jgi:hypothetical protein